MLLRNRLLLLLPVKASDFGTGGVVASVTAPVLTLTVIDDTSIKLTWLLVDAFHSNYPIEMSTDGITFNPYDTASFSNIEFIATGLTPATQYWFRIKSVGLAQTSGWSNEPDATTTATPVVSPDTPNLQTSKLRTLVGDLF